MKKVLRSLLAVAVFTMMMPFQAFASSENTVIALSTEGDKAGVQITMPENTGKNITALELRIDVSNLADANIGFEFSDLNATVKETRYREDANELVVYVAGGKQIFSNDQTFLGYVVANSEVEGNVVLNVKNNALQVADGIYGILNSSVDPVTAELKTQGSASKPDIPSPSPSEPESPAPSEPESSSSNNPESSSSSKPDNSSSNKPESSSSSKPDSASSSKPSSSSGNKPNSVPGANNGTNGGATGTTKPNTSNNKKPSASNVESEVVDSEQAEESSTSSSAESDSKSSSTSAASSSSSKSETAQSEAQKAGNTTVWVVVAVLGVVAAAAVVVIVIRNKKA